MLQDDMLVPRMSHRLHISSTERADIKHRVDLRGCLVLFARRSRELYAKVLVLWDSLLP